MSKIHSSAGALPVRLTPLSATLQCAASRAAAGRNPYEVRMTAVVYQLRDYQNSKDLERMRQALEREAAEILVQVTTEQAALGLRSPDRGE
jgi:hypothetical protein